MEFLYPLMPRSNLRDNHDILLRSIGKEKVKLQNHLEVYHFLGRLEVFFLEHMH